MSIVVNTGQTYTDTFVKGLAEGVYINETLEERSDIERLFGLSEEEIFKEYGISFKKIKYLFTDIPHIK